MSLRILASSCDYRPRLGGIATCTYELCRALSRQPGVELRLLAPRTAPGKGDDPRRDLAIDQQNTFMTARVPFRATAGASVLPLALETSRQLREFRPHALLDLVWNPSSVVSLLLTPQRALSGTRSFSVVHAMEILESDRDLKRRLRRSLSFVKKAALRQASGVFAVSQFTAELVHRECGVPRERIRTIPNGVDPDAFRPAPRAPDLVERYGLQGKTVFLSVSRLEDYKGVDRAIASLRQLAAERPVRYLVCGQGPDLERLKAITRHYRMQDHVIFAGAIESERLADYYRLADCLLLLSREDWEAPNVEGFGLVFLEAAACGVPAIGGRSGGIPDAVVDGVTGWLVDPTDDAEIARALRACALEPEERRRRGEQARARAAGELSWEQMARRMVQAMNQEILGQCAVSAALS